MVHKILKLNGKYVVQTIFREKREKRYFLKHSVPKNCRCYTTSLNLADIRVVMSRFFCILIKMLLVTSFSGGISEAIALLGGEAKSDKNKSDLN